MNFYIFQKMSCTRHVLKYSNRNQSFLLCSSNFYTSKRQKSAKPAAKVAKCPHDLKVDTEIPVGVRKTHKQKIKDFFRNNKHLAAARENIPEKYLELQRVTAPENLYLIDSKIAKKAAEYIFPDIQKNEHQIVCETNAGLGLITSELLNKEVKLVRLYESCTEFKEYLKEKFEIYEGRVELFTKDIFLLHRYEYIDKVDNGDRVEQLLKGVPTKSWDDDPVMTIIGPLPNKKFIRFLIRSLVMQSFVTSLGRIQLYVFMRPRDYITLTSGPHLNLHTYLFSSVHFNLFFDFELLEKFPRKSFLPWQSPTTLETGRYPGKIDLDYLYFVKINFKKTLPVAVDDLLALYTFVKHFFRKGTKRIIPVLEDYFPGCGLNVMLPNLEHSDYFKDMNIFTKFGELTPEQILAVFKEVKTHPEYVPSEFMTRIESQLVKEETIDTSLNDHLEKNVKSSSDSDHKP